MASKGLQVRSPTAFPLSTYAVSIHSIIVLKIFYPPCTEKHLELRMKLARCVSIRTSIHHLKFLCVL